MLIIEIIVINIMFNNEMRLFYVRNILFDNYFNKKKIKKRTFFILEKVKIKIKFNKRKYLYICIYIVKVNERNNRK